MKPSILAVDDYEPNLMGIRVILQDVGTVTAVTSGGEALRRLLVHGFDIILMDVVMPVMGGLETAELIRRHDRYKHTPIIFLTAADSEEYLQRAQAMAGTHYIVKPFTPDTLRSKVREMLDMF